MSEIYKNNHMDPRLLRTQERALQAHGREVIVKQVEIYLRRSAAKLRAEGVPLAASGNTRIDMMTFCNKGAMDEAEVYRDLAYIGGMETGWQKQQAHTGLRLENNDDKELK